MPKPSHSFHSPELAKLAAIAAAVDLRMEDPGTAPAEVAAPTLPESLDGVSDGDAQALLDSAIDYVRGAIAASRGTPDVVARTAAIREYAARVQSLKGSLAERATAAQDLDALAQELGTPAPAAETEAPSTQAPEQGATEPTAATPVASELVGAGAQAASAALPTITAAQVAAARPQAPAAQQSAAVTASAPSLFSSVLHGELVRTFAAARSHTTGSRTAHKLITVSDFGAESAVVAAADGKVAPDHAATRQTRRDYLQARRTATVGQDVRTAAACFDLPVDTAWNTLRVLGSAATPVMDSAIRQPISGLTRGDDLRVNVFRPDSYEQYACSHGIWTGCCDCTETVKPFGTSPSVDYDSVCLKYVTRRFRRSRCHGPRRTERDIQGMLIMAGAGLDLQVLTDWGNYPTTAFHTGSVSALGAARQFFAELAFLRRQARSRWRLDDNEEYEAYIDRDFLDIAVESIINSPRALAGLVGANGRGNTPQEVLNNWLADMRVTLFSYWSANSTGLPGGTHDAPTVQNVFAPFSTDWYFGSAGSFAVLTGPELDLGWYSDSALNDYNLEEFFSEAAIAGVNLAGIPIQVFKGQYCLTSSDPADSALSCA